MVGVIFTMFSFFVTKGVFWLKIWKTQGDLRTVIPLNLRVQQMCRQGPLDQIGAWGNLLLHQLKLLFCLSFSRCQTSKMHSCRRISKLFFFFASGTLDFIKLCQRLAEMKGKKVTEVRELNDCCGARDVSRVALCAPGSHLKKSPPFLWINEHLGRTGQGGAICKCHRHCLLILHIIKANIPNLYQSNQEQAITATGAPGEPRPNSERRGRGGERDGTLFISLERTRTISCALSNACTRVIKQTRSTFQQ